MEPGERAGEAADVVAEHRMAEACQAGRFWLALMRRPVDRGARRSGACAAIGRPASSTRPVHTAHAVPWPPAEQDPGDAAVGGRGAGEGGMVGARRAWEGGASVARSERSAPENSRCCLPLGAADHGEADLLAICQPMGEAERETRRNAHLRGLDHHLGGEPAGGEDLVAAIEPTSHICPAIASTALNGRRPSKNIRSRVPAGRGPGEGAAMPPPASLQMDSWWRTASIRAAGWIAAAGDRGRRIWIRSRP